MKEKSILCLQDVKRRYQTGFELKRLNLTMEAGMIVGLIGLNGSGKSTLLTCISDSEKRDAGDVFFNGQPLSRKNHSLFQEIGIVKTEQDFPSNFSPHIICKIMQKIYSNWDRDVFYDLIKEFGLDDKVKIKDLSTGMKSKLGIAVALSHRAKLLLLDEPTNGLDLTARAQVRDRLFDFVQDGKSSIMISSHILDDIDKIADRILIINEGQIILDKSKDDLLYNYQVYHVTSKQLEEMDKSTIVRYKKMEMSTKILVEHRGEFEDQYGMFKNSGSNRIEEIVEMLLKGDKIC